MVERPPADPDTPEHKRAALRATQAMLEPLSALMLDCGIGVGDLHAIVKRAFVLAASKQERDGQRPNISRIASTTGLSRAEVAQLLTDPESLPRPPRGTNRAERVLQGWWSDSDFLDAAGSPLILPIRGAKRSFTTLVKRYSGDPRVTTLLDELCRVKAVRQLPDRRVEAISRTTATVRWSPEGLETLGLRMRSHLETLIHNLNHPSRPLYEREIVNENLDPKYAAMLIRDFTSQVDTTAASMDDNLNDARVTQRPSAPASQRMRLGMGFYLFESPDVPSPAVRVTPRASRSRPSRRKPA